LTTPGTSSVGPAVNAESFFTPGRLAALLVVLAIALYSDVVFGGRTFVFRDYGFFGYPMTHYHRESFWRGDVPLWNPLNDCGVPFLAQWNSMVCYPLSLFYLLFAPAWSLAILCLFHLILAGLGMYCLAFSWSQNRLAASVAGVAFAFNGLTLNSLIYPNNIAALGWMPWVVWMVEMGWRKGGAPLIGAAVIGAIQMLTGAPEVILFTWLFVAGLWALTWFRGEGSRWSLFQRLCLVVLLIAGLGAVQLLPFLDLLAHSQRESRYADSQNSMPGTGWANFLVPLFRSYRSPQGVYFQSTQAWTSSYYVGIGILMLAVVAAGQIRTWRVRLLAATTLASAILALGENSSFYGWLRHFLPQIGFMSFPIKFVILITFCAPLLAATAASRIAECESPTAYRSAAVVGAIGLALIGLIVGFAYFYPDYYERWPRIFRNGLGRALFLVLALSALCAFRRWRSSGRPGVLLGAGLLMILWLDIVTHVPRQNPSIVRAALQPGMAALQRLTPRPEAGQSRAMLSAEAYKRFERTFLPDPLDTYLGHRLGLYFNCNLLEGLAKVDGMYSLYLREQLRVLFLLYAPTDSYASNLADFLAVSQISAPGNHLEWQARPTLMPLITGGQKPVFADAATTTRTLISPTFNPRETVLLEPSAGPFLTATNAAQLKVRPKEFSAHRVRFETDASDGALAVISQSYYHPWKARLDGRPVKLLRANHAFQAVEVPPGSHSVSLCYEDWGFRIGALVSMATLGICSAMFMSLRVPRR